MKHHNGHKTINKLDGGKGRAKKQYHKGLRGVRASDPIIDEWPPKHPRGVVEDPKEKCQECGLVVDAEHPEPLSHRACEGHTLVPMNEE